MNLLYINDAPTVYHHTHATDIYTAVQECIDIGIYNPDTTGPQRIVLCKPDDSIIEQDLEYIHTPDISEQEKNLWKLVFYYVFISQMQNIIDWHVQKMQSYNIGSKIYTRGCIHIYYRGYLKATNILDVNNYALYHRQVDSLTDRELARRDTHAHIRQEYTPSKFFYLCTIPDYAQIESEDVRDMIINHITRHHT